MSNPSNSPAGTSTWATVSRQSFGQTADDQPVELFTLSNARGLRVDVCTYGATIVRVIAPDRDGKMADVVLGYDSVTAYEAGSGYYGAVVGRFGNRIAGGRFVLDDVAFELVTNNEPGGIPCHLHGGVVGFDQRVWKAEAKAEGDEAWVAMTHFSPDGEEGYPGNLSITVTYRLMADNTLEVSYSAVTDAATPINVTQHAYFNLAGAGEGDVCGHVLQIPASRYLPVDAGLIPTGELARVEGTPFDFTNPRRIGAHIDDDHAQLKAGGGYDHCWVFDGDHGGRALAAKVFEPTSGRVMEVWTTEPGMQFYSGAFIKPGDAGKAGKVYQPRSGFCLETQHFPDSPNRPEFPTTILRPGESFRSVTAFKFGVM